MSDVNYQDEEFFDPEENETDENFGTHFKNTEEDKEISKDFMGSIGSWINDLFSVSVAAKQPVNVPQVVKANRKPEIEKIDGEYLKSLNVFKEQMKKKLKSETTVHLLTNDKFLEFNFDKLTDKKIKKKSNRISTLECSTPGSPLEKAAVVPQDSEAFVHKFPIKINEKENIYVTVRSEGSTDLNKSISIKKKSKKESSKSGELEEYFFATPPDLSRNLLLNINDQEKVSHVYKNNHLGIQEQQPYKQRRTNSCQHNARCYTTNANLIENLNANSLITVNKKNKRSVFHTSDSTATSSGNECLNPKKNVVKLKRNPFFELIGEESAFDKMKLTKASQSESSKNELKSSSEELVKHLIKKTKVSTVSQSLKKKSKNLPTETNCKNKFLQSATSSLVVNVLAKKENNLILSLKTDSKIALKNTALKPDRGIKEWPGKHRDIRFEIKKAISPRLNKSLYLNDVNDAQIDNDNSKPFKRLSEDPSLWPYRDTKEQIAKNKKGDDIRNILSKIDHRYDIIKAKQKLKKPEPENEQFEIHDGQNGRFQKQHELFKSNFTAVQPNESSEAKEVLEYKTVDDPVYCTASTNPAEVIILNTEIPVSKKQEEIEKLELALSDKTPTSSLLSENFEFTNNEGEDAMSSNERVPSPKSEKAKIPQYKNKLVKTKLLQYLKEDEMRTLLKPLPSIHTEPQSQKHVSKTYERQLPPTEIRPQKASEPVLLNRSYCTNVIGSNQKSLKLVPSGQPKNVLMLSDEKNDCEKKDVKDKKKKENTDKDTSTKSMSENCGFEQPKKPGPNCEKP